MRYIVTDAGGAVVRSGIAPNEAAIALQAGAGETPYAVAGDNGAFINDAVLTVDSGTLALRDGAMGNVPAYDTMQEIGL